MAREPAHDLVDLVLGGSQMTYSSGDVQAARRVLAVAPLEMARQVYSWARADRFHASKAATIQRFDANFRVLLSLQTDTSQRQGHKAYEPYAGPDERVHVTMHNFGESCYLASHGDFRDRRAEMLRKIEAIRATGLAWKDVCDAVANGATSGFGRILKAAPRTTEVPAPESEELEDPADVEAEEWEEVAM